MPTYYILTIAIGALGSITTPILLAVWASVREARRENQRNAIALAERLQSIQDEIRSHAGLDELQFAEHARRLDNHEGRIGELEQGTRPRPFRLLRPAFDKGDSKT